MGDIDFVEMFRLEPEVLARFRAEKPEVQAAKRAVKRQGLAEAFAICPLATAAKACEALKTPQAMVWFYLMYKVRLTGHATVVVTNGPLAELGVSRYVKYCALANLQKAGLISVRGGPRKAPQVTVLGVG
jgi:hypothetical protein